MAAQFVPARPAGSNMSRSVEQSVWFRLNDGASGSFRKLESNARIVQVGIVPTRKRWL